MDEILNHLGYVKLIGLVALGAIIITTIFHFIFRNRIGKYIPAIIFLIFGIYSLYTMNNDLASSEWLEKFLLFVLGTGGGIIGILTGLIIGIYNKEKKPKDRKRKKIED